jgi:hypothetical protein
MATGFQPRSNRLWPPHMIHIMSEGVRWDTVALLPVTPPPDLTEEDVLAVGQRRYWECGYSGWHLMLGWLSCSAMLMRAFDNRDRYWDTQEQAPSGSRAYRMAMLLDNLRELEDDRNDYLLNGWRRIGLAIRVPRGLERTVVPSLIGSASSAQRSGPSVFPNLSERMKCSSPLSG